MGGVGFGLPIVAVERSVLASDNLRMCVTGEVRGVRTSKRPDARLGDEAED